MSDPLKPSASPARSLAIGVVLKAHGLLGHVKVRSFSGEHEHFLALREVELRRGASATRRKVEEVSGGSDAIRLKLEGIDDPESARKLTGCEIWVDRGHAAKLGPGEYYLADLCGCRVLGPSGPIGTVTGVVDGGGGDLLEVDADGGRSFFVPFRDRFVGEVDVEGRTIRLTEEFSDT